MPTIRLGAEAPLVTKMDIVGAWQPPHKRTVITGGGLRTLWAGHRADLPRGEHQSRREMFSDLARLTVTPLAIPASHTTIYPYSRRGQMWRS